MARWTSPRAIWVAASLTVAAVAGGATDPWRSSLEPASSGGLGAVDSALAKLSTHRRLLVLGAHPDDEDTRLLTLVARGLGGEAAYLSLSRGEGGQNLIGSELGTELGLLRSRELLAARRVDGACQFFTRAYDFGYTRSLEETLERWPEAVLLEDAVRAARRFKPQLLVSVFPPDRRAGHGQHQAAGLVAAQLFERAGDAGTFPELAAEGLPPWRIQAFYRSTWWDREATTLELPLGRLEPLSGRSIFQLSMASRSRHRSQDMGLEQPPGDVMGQLAWVAGAGGPEADELFAGIDTRLRGITETLPEGPARRRVDELLDRVESLAVSARSRLTPNDLGVAVEPLGEVARLLRTALGQLVALLPSEGPGAAQAIELLEEKLRVAEEGLAAAAGIVADAITDRETVVPGERLAVRALLWNAGGLPVEDVGLSIVSSAGWRLVAERTPESERSFFAAEVTDERILDVELPSEAEPTVPYFLRRPRRGDVYEWGDGSAEEKGAPFGPAPLAVRFELSIGGTRLALDREVVRRYRDQATGEVRRPLRVVPAIEVAIRPRLLVWPLAGGSDAAPRQPRPLKVELRSHLGHEIAGQLRLLSSYEAETRIVPFRLEGGGRQSLEVRWRPPERAGKHRLKAVVETAGGERYERSFPVVDYEHIRATPSVEEAVVEVVAAELALPSVGPIGYVRGASDRVPEALREVGLDVALLAAEELTEGRLSDYPAIVIGPRAYETDRSLVAANGRLLDYVRGGGLLLVQYQQYQFAGGDFAPYPLQIDRPHDRVTDEAAPVVVVEPDHRVFHHPNELTAVDWRGWVQERGLYFAGSWSEEYRPLLELADPGQPPQRGALLVAPLGDGVYVYTGLAFFRQLPAGVPGAYRLLANLLALAET